MRRHGGPKTKTRRRLQSRVWWSHRKRGRSPDVSPAVIMIGAPEWARRLRHSRCLIGGGGRRAHAVPIPRRQASNSMPKGACPN
jgi:hypothetical protein